MANTDITKQVISRFFEALDLIVSNKTIRGIKTYCDMYNIDRRNLYNQRKDLNRGWFQVSWLYPLVTTYNINAEWLITGKGRMFKSERSLNKKKQP